MPIATENDCDTWLAAFQFVFPDWSAKTLQVPTPLKVTTAAAITQTDDDVGSIVNKGVSELVADPVTV